VGLTSRLQRGSTTPIERHSCTWSPFMRQ
jgi:hypothetical protein